MSEIIIYKSKDGRVELDLSLSEETLWLSQQQMADLFGTQRQAITKHIKNIFNSEELKENSVCSIMERTANASSIHVVCALGGRLDHQQANIQSLQSEYSEHYPIYLHNEVQTLEFVRDKIVHIRGQHHDHCGLFGMPEATMSVKNSGLKYGGEAPYFLSASSFSSSNQLIGNDGAIVEIKGEALIVNPPMLSSQRDFDPLDSR